MCESNKFDNELKESISITIKDYINGGGFIKMICDRIEKDAADEIESFEPVEDLINYILTTIVMHYIYETDFQSKILEIIKNYIDSQATYILQESVEKLFIENKYLSKYLANREKEANRLIRLTLEEKMKKYIKKLLEPNINEIFEKKADGIIDTIRDEMEFFILGDHKKK